MTDQPIPARSQWLNWGRIIGVVVFVLGLLYPPTRLLALGYGIGWVVVECFRSAQRALKATEKRSDKG